MEKRLAGRPPANRWERGSRRVRSMLLEEKICLVTGVAAGMGRAIALRCAEEGATVVGADVDDERGAATMNQAGGKSHYVRCDVGDLAAIEAFVNTATEDHGRIDALVNNAGITKSLGFFDVTETDWDRINRVNNKGLFFCMQAVARVMREQRSGKIVNIASIAGKGYRGTSNIAYAGTKGSVIAMTRIAASQLARYDINVNAICPGATRTDLFQQIMGELMERQGISEDDARKRLDVSIPLRRSNEPEDIANLAAWLASDQARNVTGQSWNVDGGLVWD
jgi:NAD(P)-dependent dehydrogenase (short-subunit alcohol dehydrogenase family)